MMGTATGSDRLERREQRRRERDERFVANASAGSGVFRIALAVAMVAFALLHPQFFWFIFVAIGVGTTGMRELTIASRRDAGLAPVGAPAVARNEVDALCDALLVDLKASPEAVRAFVQHPEQTVEALRTAAHQVEARRAQLIAQKAPERLASLAAQRETLAGRRDAVADPTARRKLADALESLDAQRTTLLELIAATERLEGEHTSLLMRLQELRARVALAGETPSSTPRLLEQNVQQLSAELEAITESLRGDVRVR